MSEVDAPAPSSAQPRRARLGRRLRLPLVSGKTSVMVLLACFLITGLLVVPLAGRFPAWIDVEILLGIWWIVWTAALTHLLYTGRRIDDDHVMPPPRIWFFTRKSTDKPRSSRISGSLAAPAPGKAPQADKEAPSSSSSSSSSGWNLLDGIDVDLEGCAVILGVILAAIVALIGLWLLIEIVIPGLAFLAYFLIRSMLARVANDRHRCEGDLLRAALWGALWATVYIVPQAAFVWFMHAVQSRPPGA